jgi:hypothetical protein
MPTGAAPVDFSECDEWAVDVAVKEGVRINLSDTELLLAVTKMAELGWKISEFDVATRLHISIQKAHAITRRYYRLRRLSSVA